MIKEQLYAVIFQRWSWALVLATFFVGNAVGRERVVGGPCEGCENVFVGMPEKLGPRSRIAPSDEPGEPMTIEGIVRDLDGEPVADIIVYAYHTDSVGRYPPGATPHGRLRGWARTNEGGEYRFDTIRPGPYPGRNSPQHVHMHVIEPGRVTYYIDDVMFEDDPLLTTANRRRYVRDRGGSGVSRPKRDGDGVWRVRRDIVLGNNIPDYP
jgi:protocatechuate 3,4-dioxygenase beta subunit